MWLRLWSVHVNWAWILKEIIELEPKIILQLGLQEVKLIKIFSWIRGHLISSLGKLSVRSVSANKLILSVVIAEPWTELTTWTLEHSRWGACIYPSLHPSLHPSIHPTIHPDRQARRDRAQIETEPRKWISFGGTKVHLRVMRQSCVNQIRILFYRIVSLNSLNHLGCTQSN